MDEPVRALACSWSRQGLCVMVKGAPRVADLESRREILWMELLQLCRRGDGLLDLADERHAEFDRRGARSVRALLDIAPCDGRACPCRHDGDQRRELARDLCSISPPRVDAAWMLLVP